MAAYAIKDERTQARPDVLAIHLRDGRRLAARRWQRDGETVVLLHGLLDDAMRWKPLCDVTSRSCVAFDLPGFGGSDLPSEPRVEAYAHDIAEAVQALGLRSFILVGHSFGGAVAAAVAELLASRVRALVLIAPAAFGRIALAEAVSMPGMRRLTRAVLPLALAGRAALGAYAGAVAGGPRPDPDLLDRLGREAVRLVPGAHEATRAVVAAGQSHYAFHRRRLAYHGPVTAIWGDRDRVVPPSHEVGVRTAFPQVELVIWPGVGHHPEQERLEQMMRLLERPPGLEPVPLVATGRPPEERLATAA